MIADAQPKKDSKLKCTFTKDGKHFNLYAAMNGYDIGVSNPYDANGDPAIRSRLFLHDCHVQQDTRMEVKWAPGYYHFIGDVRVNMHCDADFSLKSFTSEEEYNKERMSTNRFSRSVSGSTGLSI